MGLTAPFKTLGRAARFERAQAFRFWKQAQGTFASAAVPDVIGLGRHRLDLKRLAFWQMAVVGAEATHMVKPYPVAERRDNPRQMIVRIPPIAQPCLAKSDGFDLPRRQTEQIGSKFKFQVIKGPRELLDYRVYPETGLDETDRQQMIAAIDAPHGQLKAPCAFQPMPQSMAYGSCEPAQDIFDIREIANGLGQAHTRGKNGVGSVRRDRIGDMAARTVQSIR